MFQQLAASGPLFLSPYGPVGRLAPSPTGQLHLGNAWAFLVAWLEARCSNGRVILRIDDIDTSRSRPEYERALIEDLRWLGLDWDLGPGTGTPRHDYAQSARTGIYLSALKELQKANRVYQCFCSRRELKALASAPHCEEPFYPGTCRMLTVAQIEEFRRQGKRSSLRLDCLGQTVQFHDMALGRQVFTPRKYGGDFALLRGDGLVSYQLATAIDDAIMGVTQVVRGRDLLSSTPRQILVQSALGLSTPTYAHIPLLLGKDGERLAKRHASLSLRALRNSGVQPETVIGALAHMGGLLARFEPLRAADLLPVFNLSRIPRNDISLDQSFFLAKLKA